MESLGLPDLNLPSLNPVFPATPVLWGLPDSTPGTTPTGSPNGYPASSGEQVPWWQYLLNTALSGLVFWRQSELQSQAIRAGGGVSYAPSGQPLSIGSGAGISGSGIWTILIILVVLLLVFKLLG